MHSHRETKEGFRDPFKEPPRVSGEENQGPEKGSAAASSPSQSRLKEVTLRTQGCSVLPAGRDQQPEAEPPLRSHSHSGGAHVHTPELMVEVQC